MASLSNNLVQPYTSLDSLCRQLKLTFPKFVSKGTHWHVVNPPRKGQINGIPDSYGMLVATDGVLCVIDRINLPAFYGHVQWFVEDKEEVERGAQQQPKQRADKFVDSLLDGII